MIYVAYQLTAVPGKANELAEAIANIAKYTESDGVKQIGSFRVALGNGVGSLVYLVSFKDAEAYTAMENGMGESPDFLKAAAITASSLSAVLEPLPNSSIQ